MTLVVDCKHTGCFSCYVEIDVIMGGVGGGGGEVMTLVVDCKHRGCFWLKVDVELNPAQNQLDIKQTIVKCLDH